MLYTPERKDPIAELEQVALAINKLSVTSPARPEDSSRRITGSAVAYYGDGYYGLRSGQLRLFRQEVGQVNS